MLHMQNGSEDRGRNEQGKGRQREMVVWLHEVDCELKIATLPAKKEPLPVAPRASSRAWANQTQLL